MPKEIEVIPVRVLPGVLRRSHVIRATGQQVGDPRPGRGARKIKTHGSQITHQLTNGCGPVISRMIFSLLLAKKGIGTEGLGVVA